MPIPKLARGLIEELAQNLYDHRLQYHNFQHALETIGNAERIIENCKASGIEVDENLVYFTLLLHDAGYMVDHKKEGFETKEDYAVYVAYPFLRQFGIARGYIDLVAKTLLATKRDGEFTTVEEKVVRAADLAGLAIDYPTFLSNNLKLKAEAEMLSGKPIGWEDWKQKSREMIQFYLSQDIRLTPAYADEDGQSIFHKNTRRNLASLLEEPEPPSLS